jgi:hypothetical protein
MKNVYNIDYLKLFIQIVPFLNRKAKFLALFRIIATQIQKVHYDFCEYKLNLDQGVKSQNCYLRAELNKWFDPYKKRIFLRTITPNYDQLLTWSEASNKPFLISEETPFLLQNENGLLLNQINFEVVLPIGFLLTPSQDRLIKTILDKNKLPSKTYIIKNG